MHPILVGCCCVGVACLAAVAAPAFERTLTSAAPLEQFVAGCTLPFDAIKDEHPIDESCEIEGEGSDRSKTQNRMKNNFCASGAPRTVTINKFSQIQKASSFAVGPSAPALDRSIYSVTVPSGGGTWTEGDLVRLVGWVIDAHVSNRSAGENVNCTRGGEEWNDIHIAIAQSKSEDDLCNAVVIEMSPHFRPDEWTEITHFGTTRPMRFTGPLFFDASHGACTAAKRSKPPRLSSWEIHPVYRVEVCKFKAMSQCPAASTTAWIPFDEWVNSEDEGGQ